MPNDETRMDREIDEEEAMLAFETLFPDPKERKREWNARQKRLSIERRIRELEKDLDDPHISREDAREIQDQITELWNNR